MCSVTTPGTSHRCLREGEETPVLSRRFFATLWGGFALSGRTRLLSVF